MNFEHEPVPSIDSKDLLPLPEPHELLAEMQDNIVLIDALLDRNQAITNYLKLQGVYPGGFGDENN